MWMIELAINTMIADNKIGSQSAASETMRTSSLLQLWIKCRQTAFGPRGYSSPPTWSSPFECGVKRSDVLRSVNGTASKCKTFLATATEECCPAIGTLAGHFTRRLSPSPMPGKRIQQQRAYLPLKRSSPRPQYRSESPEIRRKEHSKKKLDNPAVFSVYSVHTEMSDNTKTSLTPVAQKFILHWGEMGTKWGINRTVAQVH